MIYLHNNLEGEWGLGGLVGGAFDGLGESLAGFSRYGVPLETCLVDLWCLL